MQIFIGALGTITEGLIRGLEQLEIGERVETIQTAALLRSVKILRSVLESCLTDTSDRPSAHADVKNKE